MMAERLFDFLTRRWREVLRAAARIYDALQVKKIIDFLKGFFSEIPEFLGHLSLRRLFKYCWVWLRSCRGNPMGLPHNPARRWMIKAAIPTLALIAMGFPIPAWAAATVRVKHTGDNTDGSTWAKAFTSVTSGLSGRAAGDILWVSSAHVLVPPNAAITWTPPAGAIYVICVTESGASSQSGNATGANESIGTGSGSFLIAAAAGARWYVYGMTVATATGNTGSNINVFATGTQAHANLLASNCTFSNVNDDTGGSGLLFGSNTIGFTPYCRFYSCVFSCISRTGYFFRPYNGTVEIINSTLSMGSSKPTPLVRPIGVGIFKFEACDLTGWNPTTAAFYDAALGINSLVIENCKLGSNYTGPFGSSGITLTSGTWVTGAGSVTVINSDNANTTSIFAYTDYLGTMGTSTTIYQNLGAQFAGAGIGWKIVTTSAASTARPFRTPFFNMWGTSTSAETPSLEIVRDNATGLTDQDVWLDVHYISAQGATGPTGLMATSRNTQPIPAVGSANTYATSSVAWTGISGFTNQTKQTVALASTITPAVAQRVKGRFACAVASTTLYINPGLAGVT